MKVRCPMLKKQIEKLRAEIAEKEIALEDLISSCEHEHIKKNYDSAECNTCGEDFGWWCPKSPDHICDYEKEDGEYDWDSCRYCGHPEERK